MLRWLGRFGDVAALALHHHRPAAHLGVDRGDVFADYTDEHHLHAGEEERCHDDRLRAHRRHALQNQRKQPERFPIEWNHPNGIYGSKSKLQSARNSSERTDGAQGC